MKREEESTEKASWRNERKVVGDKVRGECGGENAEKWRSGT
jgi:hypothetical protein